MEFGLPCRIGLFLDEILFEWCFVSFNTVQANKWSTSCGLIDIIPK